MYFVCLLLSAFEMQRNKCEVVEAGFGVLAVMGPFWRAPRSPTTVGGYQGQTPILSSPGAYLKMHCSFSNRRDTHAR